MRFIAFARTSMRSVGHEMVGGPDGTGASDGLGWSPVCHLHRLAPSDVQSRYNGGSYIEKARALRMVTPCVGGGQMLPLRIHLAQREPDQSLAMGLWMLGLWFAA